jgi:hypothetical protein
MVGAPSLAFDYRLGGLDLAAELGARLRSDVTFGTSVVGSQVTGGLGASYDVLREHWLTASAEMFFLVGTSTQLTSEVDFTPSTLAALVPAEWIVSVSTAPLLGGDFRLSLGGGGPIPTTSNGALTAPAFRLDFGLRYAPTVHNTPKPPAPEGSSLGSPREAPPPEGNDR